MRVLVAALLCVAVGLALGRAATAQAVSFGTDWKAEAEHGGYYQAIATDIYRQHGLEVTVRQGGPQVNHAQLLAAGRLDFNLAPNSFVPLNFVSENIPMVAVAAIFQKDPSVLIAHPDQGNDTLAVLKGKPIMIGSDTRIGSWIFLKSKFGYTDDQIRPYTFSVAPFLAEPKAVQQGYLSSEPFTIESQGVKPVVLLLAAGRLDFDLAPNSFVPLNFVSENIPMVAVAAIFQKDPSVLIAHQGQGNDTLAVLKGKPIMIGSDTRIGSWIFLKSKFGYTDDQIRPYTFSVAPFLAEPKAVQQGYLSSEPFTIESQGVEPVVLLLADAGYSSYGSLIQTSDKLARENPDLVQRFVDASIEGWYSYLYGDPAAGNALIKHDNSEMTDALLAYGIAKIKQYGIVDSGDAKTNGIGAMTEVRWRDFFGTMSNAGVYSKSLDFYKAFTLQFVDKKVGMKP